MSISPLYRNTPIIQSVIYQQFDFLWLGMGLVTMHFICSWKWLTEAQLFIFQSKDRYYNNIKKLVRDSLLLYAVFDWMVYCCFHGLMLFSKSFVLCTKHQWCCEIVGFYVKPPYAHLSWVMIKVCFLVNVCHSFPLGNISWLSILTFNVYILVLHVLNNLLICGS